jgi:hypothetical protein
LPAPARVAALAAACLSLSTLACSGPAAVAAVTPPPAAASAAPEPAQTTPPETPDAFWQAVASRAGVSATVLQRAVREVEAQYMSARRRAFASQLAQKLGGGLTADQVMAAFERAQHEATPPEGMLAVVARNLGVTPDALRGALMQVAPRRHPLAMGMVGRRLMDAAAGYLGMTPDALRRELGQGKTLAQVAEAHGKSAAGLEAALTRAAQEHVRVMIRTPWPKAPQQPAS